jgi:ketosteroid isomerase-like protein
MTEHTKTHQQKKTNVISINEPFTQCESTKDRVIRIYESLGSNSLDQLYELYSNDVYFEDPAHAIQGISALKSYFEKLFANVDKCQFKFHNSILEKDKLSLYWTMTLQHKSLNSGKKIFVEGSSFLKIREGKVYYHRDYFDLGNMLYENIPLLRSVIKRVKKGLTG